MYNMGPGFYGYAPMYGANIARAGFLRRIFSNFNFGNFLNQTSRTLNVVNQAIPIVNQVKPLVNNAKTIFKIANIMRDDKDEVTVSSNNTITQNRKTEIQKEEVINTPSNGPTFFL